MDTTTKSTYYLYTHTDGRQYVFHLLGTGHLATYPVVDRSPVDPEARYVEIEAPDDLETAGTETTEEEMRSLTGYWLEGSTVMDEIAIQLSRVRPDDRSAPAARALLAILQGTPLNRWER